MDRIRRVSWSIGTVVMAYLAEALVASCAMGTGEQLDEDEADTDVGVATEGLATFRGDQVETLTPPGGPWGDYKDAIYCNPNTWAIGFDQRVELHKGGDFDDTELNSVRLICADRNGVRTEKVSSYDGLYGDWGNEAKCSSGGFVKGAHIKLELPVSGDDTAANGVEMTCTNGGVINAGNDGGYGSYNNSAWDTCTSANAAVCGIAIKYEAHKGGDFDDTAMNGLRLFCCSK